MSLEEIETFRDGPNQYNSFTIADIYALRKRLEDYSKGIDRRPINIEWELDYRDPEPLKMYYKMHPTIEIPSRKFVIFYEKDKICRDKLCKPID